MQTGEVPLLPCAREGKAQETVENGNGLAAKPQGLTKAKVPDRVPGAAAEARQLTLGSPMRRKSDWPAGLGPFREPKVDEQTVKFKPEIQQGWDELAEEIVLRSIRHRVSALAKHFGMKWPQSEEDWLRLTFEICRRAAVPGFQSPGRRRGAPIKWNYDKNTQLLGDVRALQAKGLNEHAACRHIANNKKQFSHRYKVDAKTLYRQLQRAKRDLEEKALLVEESED
jgi:hypothetical protein